MIVDDKDWLNTLNAKSSGPHEVGSSKYVEQWELDALLYTLSINDYFVVDLVAKWGFHLILRVFEDSPCLGVEPELFLSLGSDQLRGDPTLSEAWELFGPSYTSARNAQKRKFYGWPPPKEFDHFTY